MLAHKANIMVVRPSKYCYLELRSFVSKKSVVPHQWYQMSGQGSNYHLISSGRHFQSEGLKFELQAKCF